MNNLCNCQNGCCGSSIPESPEFFPGKAIPSVSTQLTWKDRWGAIKVRFGIGRKNYAILPGLYRVGEPNAMSPVFVSANYKLSFDYLRSHLKGIHAWILVLDTRGINVWCAAGGGLFGTHELIRRIHEVHLHNVVQHRKLILPQLSAPGVAAHEVARATGFKVQYGPVDAKDIQAYLKRGESATVEMRRVRFPLKARLVLIPMEFIQAFKFFPLVFFWILAFRFFQEHHVFWGIPKEFLLGISAILGGSVLFQILLPWLPFRSFILNGWILGLAVILITGIFIGLKGQILFSFLLLFSPLTAYLAFHFTGATPFTSLSGVKKEFKYGIPLLLFSTGLGIVFQLLIIL